jgi:hypothetical protein
MGSTSPRFRILAPDWYAEMIGPPCVQAEDAIVQRFGTRMASLSACCGPLRGLLVALAARPGDVIAAIKKAPGTTTLLLVEAWVRRRRRVVVLEFLPRGVPRRGLLRLVYRSWLATTERPAVRRAMRVGAVLTAAERDELARCYRVPRARLRHIPWALVRSDEELPPYPSTSKAVVCSGRASCDWPTLFAAARGATWPLTVIGSRVDLPLIERLNHEGRAEVLCEVSRDEHDARLRTAALYLICLRETGPSAGHVRLMAAVGAGAPVIASGVPGLREYVEDGRTAVLVEPSNPDALRHAVDDLLADPSRREQLRQRAFERARTRTYREYFDEVRGLLFDEGRALLLEG